MREDTLGPLGRTTDVLPEQLYYAISEKMLPYEYSVYKHERRIKSALAQMDQIEAELLPKVTAADPHNLVKANTVRNYLQMCRLCQLASLERKESRLIHYREEYPYRDDINWLKWVILKRQDSGVVVRTEPVPLDRYRIVPQERVKIPAKVNFGEAYRPHLDKTN